MALNAESHNMQIVPRALISLCGLRTGLINVCVRVAVEKKAAVRQKRDDLVRRNPGETETGAEPQMNTR